MGWAWGLLAVTGLQAARDGVMAMRRESVQWGRL